MYHNPEAARQIVSIQNRLAGNLAKPTRAALIARQRDIWAATYPGRSFDEIVADTRVRSPRGH